MASQTKVEPTGPAVPAVPAARGSQTESAARAARGGAEAEGLDAGGGREPEDDEDVSLDELMISDSNDPTDEQEPAEAQASNGHTNERSEPLVAAEESEPAPESDMLLDAEDDEEASRAAAAAAQEAAAQRAVLESAARHAAPEAAMARNVEVDEDARDEEPPGALENDVLTSGSERDTEVNVSVGDDLPLDDGYGMDALGSSETTDVDSRDGARAEAEAFDADEPRGAMSSASDHLVEEDARISEPPQTQRRDAPLPSFDIPEADARASARRTLTGTQPSLDGRSSNRASSRPIAAPLSQLSEISEEDDDDAVTHIGLPVLETSSDYSLDADESEYPSDRGGFAVADPGIAALAEYNPDLSQPDGRRATTRVIPRIDPSLIQHRQREMDTMPPVSRGGAFSALSSWWSRLSSRLGNSSFGADANRNRLAWFADNALRPVSLVLVGSGIGAVIMLTQLDTSARVAQEDQAVQSLKQLPEAHATKPTTLIERAEAGEGDALFKITNMPASERTSALTLALERGQQTQKLNEFNEFVRTLDPRAPLPPNMTVRYLGYATSPETMLPAFAHISGWQGSRGPDMLYAIWEKAPGGARAAGLAQQLLHSADQRSKATPSLKTVLDLRAATSCEDYLRVLPAVLRDGDQRCSATLRALKHTDGCGDDGQQDCYGCLRDGKLLDEALTSVENRVPPQL